MRRRRNALYVLIAVISLVCLAIYLNLFGWWGVPIGWVVMIVGIVAASTLLRCPKCGARLGSVSQNVCTSCGALLTDTLVILPNQQGIDPAAAAYMAESRRLLGKWARIRKKLRWSPYWIGLATMVGMFVFMPASDLSEQIGVGVFIGLVGAGAGWLLLTHIVDNAVGIAFLAFRGRCPLCRVWFNPPSSFGPGSIELDYSLPHFCASCGANLG